MVNWLLRMCHLNRESATELRSWLLGRWDLNADPWRLKKISSPLSAVSPQHLPPFCCIDGSLAGDERGESETIKALDAAHKTLDIGNKVNIT